MKKILLTGLVATLLTSNVFAGGITKDIKFQAQVSDGILVTKPDGISWYDDVQTLSPVDFDATGWTSSELDVRVRTKVADNFTVEMPRPLQLTNVNGGSMKNVNLRFAGQDLQLNGTTQGLKTYAQLDANHDSIYKMQVTTGEAVDMAGVKAVDGTFSGTATMVFTAQP